MPAARDSEELARVYRDDQADRTAAAVEWSVVGPRDRARLRRVKELLTANGLRTAEDYYHAAMVLQHGEAPEDFLLGHELCVVAISLGKNDRPAKWLAAASEDRFLMNLGLEQRFATQFRSDGKGPMQLYQVGEGITDELRRLMGVPTLAETRQREAELNKK